VSANLINFQDEEEICAASTSAKKASILLQRIAPPLESGHSYYFHRMTEIMDAHGNIATRDLANKMQQDLAVERSKPKDAPTGPVTISPLSEVRPPPERATLQQQPMLPRGVNSPPAITSHLPVATSSVDATDEGLEHIDLKGTGKRCSL